MTADLDDAGGAEVVDVGRDPAAVEERAELVGGLVVAADEDGENRSHSLARVVLPERIHRAVLVCGVVFLSLFP